ncbi:MAG: helix-turn-helix transcriptional regulator, partial [Umezawaea sp.]
MHAFVSVSLFTMLVSLYILARINSGRPTPLMAAGMMARCTIVNGFLGFAEHGGRSLRLRPHRSSRCASVDLAHPDPYRTLWSGGVVPTRTSPAIATWELALRLRQRRERMGVEVKTITQVLGFSRNYWSAIEDERKLLSEEALIKLFELLEF